MMGCILGNVFLFPNMIFATSIPTDHFMYSSKCPKEKPFEGSWSGICVGCDSLSVLEVTYEHEADFDICPNRETDHWISYLKTCPKDAPLRDIQRNCISCDEIKQGVSVKNKTDCDICPNAKYDEKNKICVIYDCPKERPMKVGTSCFSCDSERVEIPTEECLKCSKNRKISHGFCIFKNSIYQDKPLIGYDIICREGCITEAQFYSCDISKNISTTKENCNQCSNRKWLNGECRLK